LRVSNNFYACVDCKSIYIFCISEWPRGFNFIIFLAFPVAFGEVKETNTEVVQSTAALNTV
jgi:hypothetical protein